MPIAVARDVPALRAAVARLGRVALVPTMGALHEGHLALVREARRHADAVVASIFVNPLQFTAAADLARYPRDEAADLAALESAGCALAWLPAPEAMYPPGFATAVAVAGLSARWEGEHRPGHFGGVATVCCKLFAQTGAPVAVFGEKDWQQLQVVRRMAADLDLPVRVLGHPTVREADGLAMSSRNRFLSPDERARAAALPAALREAAALLADGRPATTVLEAAEAKLHAAGMETDYLALVDGATLEPLAVTAPGARLLAAMCLGSVRLLDNWPVG